MDVFANNLIGYIIRVTAGKGSSHCPIFISDFS